MSLDLDQININNEILFKSNCGGQFVALNSTVFLESSLFQKMDLKEDLDSRDNKGTNPKWTKSHTVNCRYMSMYPNAHMARGQAQHLFFLHTQLSSTRQTILGGSHTIVQDRARKKVSRRSQKKERNKKQEVKKVGDLGLKSG